MEEKIAQLQVEKLELENKFLNPDFLKSPDYLEAQKKYNRISEIIETYQKLQKLQKQIKENKELIDKNDDQELINLAISDNSQKELEKKIKDLKKESKDAPTTPDRISLMKKAQNLETDLETMREAHAIERKKLSEDKSNKISSIEKSLAGTATTQNILLARWKLI